jgi:hypothetical protein
MFLRRIQDEIGLHKLNSRWEGPFIVHKVTGPGRIAYSTLMARRFQTPGISSIYDVSILSQPRHLLSAPGDQNFQYNSILLVYDWYYMQVC